MGREGNCAGAGLVPSQGLECRLKGLSQASCEWVADSRMRREHVGSRAWSGRPVYLGVGGDGGWRAYRERHTFKLGALGEPLGLGQVRRAPPLVVGGARGGFVLAQVWR